MGATYDENILDNYPQPLAATYARFIDQRDATAQHNLLLAVCECVLKYLAAAATAQYLALRGEDTAVSEALSRLAHPSLGHWAALLRAVLGWRRQQQLPDGDFIFPELIALYSKSSPDLPAGVALVRRVRGTSETRASLRQVFDALVEYRNQQAHGAGPSGLDHAAMAPLLQAAVEEALLALPSLTAQALTFVESINIERGGTQLLSLLRLMSDRPRLRVAQQALAPEKPRPEPQQLYLQRGADSGAISLHPLLVFLPACAVCREAQVGVLNGLVAQGGEYLCYGCGHSNVLAAAAADIAAILPGRPAAEQPAPPRATEQQQAPAQPPSHRHDLPPELTAFVGRGRESEALLALLRRPGVRLVTLTGPGGSGKTRLALHCAGQLLGDFPDGVLFVDLAPLTNPELVLPTVARVLGIQDAAGRPLLELVQAALAAKRLLLVLDNFEHLAPAAALVGDLLKAGGELKLLITSRMPLHIYGEKEFAVQPLALPRRGPLPPLEDLAQYDAVKLFVERAQDVKAGFALSAENAQAVVEICSRLDGLPLAIELAAARVKLLPPAAILQRLASSLQVLTGGARDRPTRQQTLRNAIAWSYDLLGTAEQTLFRRLAVFGGGATLEAIEAVCAAASATATGSVEALGIDVLDGIQSLVDKSLLRPIEVPAADGGEPRFMLLATIREFAAEALRASGEDEALRQQHAAYFLALAEQAEPLLLGTGSDLWLERLEQEHNNFRAALQWTLQAQPGQRARLDTGLRLGGALGWFWYVRGFAREGRHWLEGILALLDPATKLSRVYVSALAAVGDLAWLGADYAAARAYGEEGLRTARQLGDPALTARLLRLLAMTLNFAQGDTAGARSLYEQSLDIDRQLGNKYDIAFQLANLAWIDTSDGEFATARDRAQEALALAGELGDKALIAICLARYGRAAYYQGDYPAAHHHYAQSLTLFRELEFALFIGGSLTYLGYIALRQGDHQLASQHFREGLTLGREAGIPWATIRCLAGLAALAAVNGQATHAAKLFGAAERLQESAGGAWQPVERPELDQDIAVARAQLGAETWRQAWEEGQSMTAEQALAYALRESTTTPSG